jgi:predicted porin
VSLYGKIGAEQYDGVEYDQTEYYTSVGIWPAGSLYVGLDTGFGDAIDYRHGRAATFLDLEPFVEYKIGRRLDVILTHEYQRLSAEEDRLFSANVSYLHATYQFTRRAFLRAILQYESTDVNEAIYGGADEDALATQVLFSYKINPQTVFYLGYSDSYYGTDRFCLTQADRAVFAKIGYAWVM